MEEESANQHLAFLTTDELTSVPVEISEKVNAYLGTALLEKLETAATLERRQVDFGMFKMYPSLIIIYKFLNNNNNFYH